MSLFELLKTPSPYKKGASSSGGNRSTSSFSSNTKKIQSTIKSLVQLFGKHVNGWMNDTKHLVDTTTALLSLYNTLRAIHRCLNSRNDISWQFPDLKTRLLGLLTSDIENTIYYIKIYLKGMSDLTAAMRSTVSDGMNLITDEEPSHLHDTNDVFTIDHILTMQTIHSQIELEYGKYCRLFDNFTRFNGVKSYCDINDIDTYTIEEEISTLLMLNQALLDGTIDENETGTNANENTFLNKSNIQIFLMTNNITPD